MNVSDLTQKLTAKKVAQYEKQGFTLVLHVASKTSTVGASPSGKLYGKTGLRDYGLLSAGQPLLVVSEDAQFGNRYHQISADDLKDVKKAYAKAQASHAAVVAMQSNAVEALADTQAELSTVNASLADANDQIAKLKAQLAAKTSTAKQTTTKRS